MAIKGTYAEYYHLSAELPDNPPHPVRVCGSDAIRPIDGRLNLASQVRIGEDHAKRLNTNLCKGIVGFRIMRDDTPISSYIEL